MASYGNGNHGEIIDPSGLDVSYVAYKTENIAQGESRDLTILLPYVDRQKQLTPAATFDIYPVVWAPTTGISVTKLSSAAASTGSYLTVRVTAAANAATTTCRIIAASWKNGDSVEMAAGWITIVPPATVADTISSNLPTTATGGVNALNTLAFSVSVTGGVVGGIVSIVSSSNAAVLPLDHLGLEKQQAANDWGLGFAPIATGTSVVVLKMDSREAGDKKATVNKTITITATAAATPPDIIGFSNLPSAIVAVKGISTVVSFSVNVVSGDGGHTVGGITSITGSSNTAVLPTSAISLNHSGATYSMAINPPLNAATGSSTVTIYSASRPSGTLRATVTEQFVVSVFAAPTPDPDPQPEPEPIPPQPEPEPEPPVSAGDFAKPSTFGELLTHDFAFAENGDFVEVVDAQKNYTGVSLRRGVPFGNEGEEYLDDDGYWKPSEKTRRDELNGLFGYVDKWHRFLHGGGRASFSQGRAYIPGNIVWRNSVLWICINATVNAPDINENFWRPLIQWLYEKTIGDIDDVEQYYGLADTIKLRAKISGATGLGDFHLFPYAPMRYWYKCDGQTFAAGTKQQQALALLGISALPNLLDGKRRFLRASDTSFVSANMRINIADISASIIGGSEYLVSGGEGEVELENNESPGSHFTSGIAWLSPIVYTSPTWSGSEVAPKNVSFVPYIFLGV